MSLTSNQRVKTMDEDQIEALAAGFEFDGAEVAAEPIAEEIEQDEGTTQEEVDESPEGEADEESTESDVQPEDWREKRLAKLTHKQKRAEEKLREMEQELSKYKQAPEKAQGLPEVPDYPSADLQYDDPNEWKRQVQAREAALVERAKAEYRQTSTQEQATARQTEEIQGIVQKYTSAGIEAGISKDKMAYNEEVLIDSGVSPDLAKYLYSDAKGAQLVNYLADTPAELEKVAKMSPYAAVEYITTAVKPKAGVTRSKATKAPNPVGKVKGSGASSKNDFDEILPAGYSIG